MIARSTVASARCVTPEVAFIALRSASVRGFPCSQLERNTRPTHYGPASPLSTSNSPPSPAERRAPPPPSQPSPHSPTANPLQRPTRRRIVEHNKYPFRIQLPQEIRSHCSASRQVIHPRMTGPYDSPPHLARSSLHARAPLRPTVETPATSKYSSTA